MGRQWVAAFAAGVVLAGCSTGAPGAGGDAAASSPAAPTATASVSAAPAPVPGVVEYHDGRPLRPVEADPGWDEASRTAAVDAAVRAMGLFARPDAPFEAWWADLSPTLSTQAQVDYQYVDPAAVPARAVTGPGVLVDEASAFIAGVQVPTDVGTYTVVLSRTGAGAAWLVERLTPPEGQG